MPGLNDDFINDEPAGSCRSSFDEKHKSQIEYYIESYVRLQSLKIENEDQRLELTLKKQKALAVHELFQKSRTGRLWQHIARINKQHAGHNLGHIPVFPLDAVALIVYIAALCGIHGENRISEFYEKRYLEFLLTIPGIPHPKYHLPSYIVKIAKAALVPNMIQRLVDLYYKAAFELEKLLPKVNSYETALKNEKLAAQVKNILKKAFSPRAADEQTKRDLLFIQHMPHLEFRGYLIAGDTMCTRPQTAEAILDQQCSYLLCLKKGYINDQMILDLENFFTRQYGKARKQLLTRSRSQRAHGRIEEELIEVMPSSVIPRMAWYADLHKNMHTLVRYTKTSTDIVKNNVIKQNVKTWYYLSSLECSEANTDKITQALFNYWYLLDKKDLQKIINPEEADKVLQLLNKNEAGLVVLSDKFAHLVRNNYPKLSRPPTYSAVQDIILPNMPIFNVLEYLTDFEEQRLKDADLGTAIDRTTPF